MIWLQNTSEKGGIEVHAVCRERVSGQPVKDPVINGDLACQEKKVMGWWSKQGTGIPRNPAMRLLITQLASSIRQSTVCCARASCSLVLSCSSFPFRFRRHIFHPILHGEIMLSPSFLLRLVQRLSLRFLLRLVQQRLSLRFLSRLVRRTNHVIISLTSSLIRTLSSFTRYQVLTLIVLLLSEVYRLFQLLCVRV